MGEGARNDSGVAQVYYVCGAKHLVKPGEVVPEAHLTRDLREVLRKPYVVPRRPYPSVRRMVEVAGQPGMFASVTVPASPENRARWLAERPTITASRPDLLPGPSRLVASTRAGLRWVVDPTFPPNGSDGERVGALADGMRAVLRGESVEGLRLSGPVPSDLSDRRTLVVVCVHDAPRYALDCLASILSDPDAPALDLAVVDDGSTEAARDLVEAAIRPGSARTPTGSSDASWRSLEAVDGSRVRGFYHRRSEARGYLDSANLGASLLDPAVHDSIAFVNSDAIVGPGWLRALRRALAREGVGFANPLSNENVDASVRVPPGCDPAMFSDALLIASDGEPVEALTPTGFCLAVRVEVWRRFGPFDASLWGTGYGEETHLVLVARKAGWISVHVPDAFVWHARSRSHGREDGSTRSREAGAAIRRIHGSWFDGLAVEAARADRMRTTRERVASLVRLPSRNPPSRRVAWYLKSTLLCGGVYAVLYLSDALRRIGWDSVVCALEPVDLDLYPNRSAVFAFDGEGDFRRSFSRDVFDRGFLVSASWVTSEAVEQVERASGGDVVGVHFMQDDERRFEFNVGYGPRIEQAWANERVVGNSRWVCDVVATRSLRPPKLIRVGVDPAIFHPRPRPPSDALRVVALSRGETRHRGSDVLFLALREAERLGVPLDVRLFGSRPSDSGFASSHVGRLAHEDLAPIVASSDVLVDPSRFQGFGLDAVQALACGTALVCTSNLGCDEYAVDGGNALIVAPEDPSAIAAALVRLHRDRSLLARLQAAGPPSVVSLSWEALAREWSDYLTGLAPW